jgi:hypothetical protein
LNVASLAWPCSISNVGGQLSSIRQPIGLHRELARTVLLLVSGLTSAIVNLELGQNCPCGPVTENICTVAVFAEETAQFRTDVSLPQSASEIYLPSDRRLSAKLVPTFTDQRDGFLWPYFRFSRPEQLLLLPSSSSDVLTRLSGPRPNPSLLRKSGGTGNRTRASGSVARNYTSIYCETWYWLC